MQNFPYSSIATLVAWAVFTWTSIMVGNARTKYGVKAPAVTGNEQFERRFRVEMNTLEQLALLLPALWLCAFWVGDLYAAAGGLLWSVGRIIYAFSYISDPEKRGPGFGLTFLSSFAMAAAALVFIVKSVI